MLAELRQAVHKTYTSLAARGLSVQQWGNVSGVDRKQGLIVITPSGLSSGDLRPEDLVVLSLKTGEVIEGGLRPSSDTPTHLVLYRSFKDIGSIVHTHSAYATAWAQAGKNIPVFGTTHADHWNGEVFCTRQLRGHEIKKEYELNTGVVITETMQGNDPMQRPGVLVAGHGAFVWGKSPSEALYHATALEFVAELASQTLRVNPKAKPIKPVLLRKHYERKHGPNSYYGQEI